MVSSFLIAVVSSRADRAGHGLPQTTSGEAGFFPAGEAYGAAAPLSRRGERGGGAGHGAGADRHTTVSGRSFLPVGPIWISVPIVGQTPQS
ncbi:hypothetical protein GCM10010466_41010 [Planomonospora alba]|uniref:Uncharacterized protein n=1 Tax=Planomonospora alba TaxID=161354 RepID=A0ABP6NEI9_9ACTN